MMYTKQKDANYSSINNDRLYLDIVKGFAIFLMLWGHCIQCCANDSIDFFENPVFKLIYSFHMPLFMMVSGYLFFFSAKKRDLGQLLVHRTQSLLQPIIMCGIFNYIITDLVVKHDFKTFFDGKWFDSINPHSFSSLWFLWSVLSASIVVGIAIKSVSNKASQGLILLLGLVFVCLFPNWEGNLFLYPYFVIGYLFARVKDHLPKVIINIKYLSFIAFPVMLLFYDKKHYIYTTGIISSENKLEMISIDLFRWGIGLVGSIFALVIIELLFIFIFVKKPMLAKPVAQLGVKSLQVYCISIALLSFWLPRVYAKFCNIIGYSLFATNMWLYNLLFTPCLAIVYAIAIYFFVKLLEKIKVSKVIFGR